MKVKEFKTFEIQTRSRENYIAVTNRDLRNSLREILHDDILYHDVPVVKEQRAVGWLAKLNLIKNESNETAELCKYLTNASTAQRKQVEALVANRVISYDLCMHLFPEDAEIIVCGDELQGGRVTATKYVDSFFGSMLEVTYSYIGTDGVNFGLTNGLIKIPSWEGTKPIANLPVRPIDQQEKQQLALRGDLFRRIGTGANYMRYNGLMDVWKWWRWESQRAHGRIMVDEASYAQFVDGYLKVDQQDIEAIHDDNLWMCSAYVKGFSFATKQMGRFALSQINDIQFNDSAFDQLVMDLDKKQLIESLVTTTGSQFQDIIGGKGGGCIFLLHGEPGVGKTLTAEAIAELLHRPLYSVSVGELGVNPEELERNLRRILDIAQIWNAVILIDEADIFLEKRSEGDILRNAMVGIFLRLLEYHAGVLFLTTNRVREFDPAFHSRISVALKYGKLTRHAREQIWSNLLSAAGITELDPHELSKYEINGRQIKTTIRLAMGLAAHSGVPVNAEHVRATLAISQQFVKDLSAKE